MDRWSYTPSSVGHIYASLVAPASYLVSHHLDMGHAIREERAGFLDMGDDMRVGSPFSLHDASRSHSRTSSSLKTSLELAIPAAGADIVQHMELVSMHLE